MIGWRKALNKEDLLRKIIVEQYVEGLCHQISTRKRKSNTGFSWIQLMAERFFSNSLFLDFHF